MERYRSDEIIYPRLNGVRFHDLRHTAVTVMAEAGLPDQVIMAQVGHISREMLQHYSHIRQHALNTAAAALEPRVPKPAPAEAELINSNSPQTANSNGGRRSGRGLPLSF